MAKQIAGLCFFVGTIDDLTFYKMDGQYYCRAKSSLTGERVKNSPAFKLTMMSARRMARASKIGTAIYKALPPRWRQFWMYRSFTGEAFTLLKNTSRTENEITAQLRACYVDYWEQRRLADPGDPVWLPAEKKVRKRRQYSEESLQRRLDKVKASRPRQEIRAEKKKEELQRKQAWIEKLAAREAARTAAQEREATIRCCEGKDVAAPPMANAVPVQPGAVAVTIQLKDTGNRSSIAVSDAVQSRVDEPVSKGPSIGHSIKQLPEFATVPAGPGPSRWFTATTFYSHWYIDQQGHLQIKNVPEASCEGPTGTHNKVVGYPLSPPSSKPPPSLPRLRLKRLKSDLPNL